MNLPKTLLALAVIVSCLQTHAWQIDSGDLNGWLQKLKPSTSVSEQVALFWENNNISDRPSDYIRDFPLLAKEKFISEMKTNLSCTNEIKVDFVERILPNRPQAASRFENGFLRIESLNCLGKLDLNKVFSAFMSNDFQKRTIMGLKKMTVDESKNWVCQETSVFGIGRSSFCFTQNIWQNDSKYVIHSFNETNTPNIQAPVYFREVITVFEKLPSDDIVVYNLAYGRGPDLGFKSVVKGVVKDQQKSLIQELIRSSQ